jgi:hypothetical protein
MRKCNIAPSTKGNDMTSIKLTWKFANGRRGFHVVHVDRWVEGGAVRRADFISRMSLTVVPVGAELVTWTVVEFA